MPQEPSNPNTEPVIEPTNVSPQEPATTPEPASTAPAAEFTNPIAPDSPAIITTPPSPAAVPAVVTAGGSPLRRILGDKKKLKLIIASVAGLAVLLGGGAIAYAAVAAGNPQKITQDAITNSINSEKLKSAAIEGELSFSGGDISKAISSISFEGAGDADKVDLKVTANTAATKINLEYRKPDAKSAYVRLSGLNGIDKLLAGAAGQSAESSSFAQFVLPLVSKISDQWYVVDESYFKQLGVDMSDVETGKLSKEDAKKIGDLYKKNQFLKAEKKGDQDIHGVASYHLRLSVDKDKLKAFLGDLKAANIKDLKLEQKDIDEVAKFDFSKYPVELWVGKKQRFVTQIATSFVQSGTTYKLRLAFKDFNKPVNVEKPADAKSLLDLLGDFGLGAVTDNVSDEYNARARDTERVTDLNDLKFHLEAYYNDNDGYPSTFTAATLDGIDAQALKDPDGKPITMNAPVASAADATLPAATRDAGYLYIPYGCTGTVCNGYRIKTFIERPSATGYSNPYIVKSLN